MKENNGRGARKMLLRRLATVGVVCTGCVGVVWLFGGGNSNHQPGWTSRVRRVAKQVAHDTRNSLRDESSLLEAIAQARVHLIDLKVDPDLLSLSDATTQYAGLTGVFCKVNWESHKEDPSRTPMFRFLVEESHCQEHSFSMDLAKAVKAIREYDDTEHTGGARVLDLPLVVFHESRCGSTLVANLLAAMEPAKHRVYSESSPPLAALRVCGDDYQHCTQDTAAAILKDVIYLMRRSDDPLETRVFFKIQSAGSRHIATFQAAFPETPWLFVYREPVQVMMSHLKAGKRANCVRPQKSSIQPQAVLKVLHQYHAGGTYSQLSHQEYCAAHLASITETAVSSLTDLAIPVNYVDLPDRLYEILPYQVGVTVSPAAQERMQAVAGVYSKGANGKAGEFQEDSTEKEAQATPEIRAAAAQFLSNSYAVLEEAAKKSKAEAYRAKEEDDDADNNSGSGDNEIEGEQVDDQADDDQADDGQGDEEEADDEQADDGEV